MRSITNFILGICGIIAIISISFTGIAATIDNSSMHQTYMYSFERPQINEVFVNGDSYDVVSLPDAVTTGNVYEPCLPAKGAYILLPYGKSVDKITVSLAHRTLVGTDVNVLPTPASQPFSAPETAQLPLKKSDIYTSTEAYPGIYYEKIGTYLFRGYTILVLSLYPVQYIPSTGDLYYYKTIEITLDLRAETDDVVNFRGLEKDYQTVLGKIDNPETTATYTNMASASQDSYDMMILTSDSLKSSFETLAEYHNARGLKTFVKTLSDITSGSSIDDIREYIRESYVTLGIDYVLIGGDDGIIPGPMLWVSGMDEETWYYETYMPSDLFYACLDGSYNSDGDDKYGEPTDGEGGNDVDLMADVYVGRACVDDRTEAENFITKTIGYLDTVNDDYLKDMLLAGEILDSETAGGDYMDELIDICTNNGYTTQGIPSDNFEIHKLYDRDAIWSAADIQQYINDGIHVVSHNGHSNYEYALKMVTDDVQSFSNSKYCLIYSQGCMAGGFDREDCIAEYLTVKTDTAAFAAIMNARYGFYWNGITDGDNQHYMREFWDAIFAEGINVISKANQDSKEDNLHIIGKSMMRWVYYQLNLFGDPSVALKLSNAPDTPTAPIGEARIEADTAYSYTTSAIDSDGDTVMYRWDWGDGTYSDWLGPYASGATVNASHTWSEKGAYSIKVKAKDSYGTESAWSNPLRITVPKPYTSPLIALFERLSAGLFLLLKNIVSGLFP